MHVLTPLLLLHPDQIEERASNLMTGLTLRDVFMQENDGPEWFPRTGWDTSNVLYYHFAARGHVARG